MTMRNAFHPLIGDHTKSFAGDVIDALSISCTTFGVYVLRFGLHPKLAVLPRMDGSVTVLERYTNYYHLDYHLNCDNICPSRS